MARGRPASYTTLAIMNFVVGGFALLCSVCGGIDMEITVNGRNVAPELKQFLNQEIPGYTAYKIGGMVLGMALALGLIVSGVGLLQVSSWGRWLAIACSAVLLLHHIALTVLQLAFVNPATSRFFSRLAFINFSFMPNTIALFGVIWEVLAGIYYLVQILVLSFYPPATYRAHDEDEYEDRPRRRRRDEEDEYDDRPRRPRRRRDWDD